jgi:hypothetical protein
MVNHYLCRLNIFYNLIQHSNEKNFINSNDWITPYGMC